MIHVCKLISDLKYSSSFWNLWYFFPPIAIIEEKESDIKFKVRSNLISIIFDRQLTPFLSSILYKD